MHGKNNAFYSSTYLKDWKLESQLTGYYECPEIFELPIEGSDESYWVTFAADGKYALGRFDGKTFTPTHVGKHQLHHGKFYASQTFDNSPDGRRIAFTSDRDGIENIWTATTGGRSIAVRR